VDILSGFYCTSIVTSSTHHIPLKNNR